MYCDDVGVTLDNYISYFQSPWHRWFVELGYPRLDIVKYKDGEWKIIEYQTSPVVPCLTKFRDVLVGMRNVEITFSFVKRWVRAIDICHQEIWDREEAKTKEIDREEAATDRHREDSAERATQAVLKNPDLMERIMQRGMQEMDISFIRRHIPNYKF